MARTLQTIRLSEKQVTTHAAAAHPPRTARGREARCRRRSASSSHSKRPGGEGPSSAGKCELTRFARFRADPAEFSASEALERRARASLSTAPRRPSRATRCGNGGEGLAARRRSEQLLKKYCFSQRSPAHRERRRHKFIRRALPTEQGPKIEPLSNGFRVAQSFSLICSEAKLS